MPPSRSIHTMCMYYYHCTLQRSISSSADGPRCARVRVLHRQQQHASVPIYTYSCYLCMLVGHKSPNRRIQNHHCPVANVICLHNSISVAAQTNGNQLIAARYQRRRAPTVKSCSRVCWGAYWWARNRDIAFSHDDIAIMTIEKKEWKKKTVPDGFLIRAAAV